MTWVRRFGILHGTGTGIIFDNFFSKLIYVMSSGSGRCYIWCNLLEKLFFRRLGTTFRDGCCTGKVPETCLIPFEFLESPEMGETKGQCKWSG